MEYLIGLYRYLQGPTSFGLDAPTAPTMPYYVRVVGAFLLISAFIVIGQFAHDHLDYSFVTQITPFYRALCTYIISECVLINKLIVWLAKCMIGKTDSDTIIHY